MGLTTNSIVKLGNNVHLVKIEGADWYTIYHHLPVKGVSNSSINQPTNGKRTSMFTSTNFKIQPP
jgi:hypothetical protein